MFLVLRINFGSKQILQIPYAAAIYQRAGTLVGELENEKSAPSFGGFYCLNGWEVYLFGEFFVMRQSAVVDRWSVLRRASA
jgi:hypothetical protein